MNVYNKTKENTILNLSRSDGAHVGPSSTTERWRQENQED